MMIMDLTNQWLYLLQEAFPEASSTGQCFKTTFFSSGVSCWTSQSLLEFKADPLIFIAMGVYENLSSIHALHSSLEQIWRKDFKKFFLDYRISCWSLFPYHK